MLLFYFLEKNKERKFVLLFICRTKHITFLDTNLNGESEKEMNEMNKHIKLKQNFKYMYVN